MKRVLIFLLIALVTIVAIISVITSAGKAGARRALNDYKAKLKAQGEKLTWQEWGYPRVVESNDCLPRLVQAVGTLRNRGFSPGTIKLMDLSSATNIQPGWAKDDLFLTDKTMAKLSWDEFRVEMESARPALVKIRQALSNPPRYVVNDPTNLVVRRQFQSFEQRSAALWLSADTILALRQREMGRVQENLWALQQLVHLHEDDFTLVSQMIRVAITGLALADTWEALQSPGWHEPELAELQRGWERINLFASLEKGLLAERLFLNAIFSQVRTVGDSAARVNYMNSLSGGANAGSKSFAYYWQVLVAMPVWQVNLDADELLALRHEQNCLDSIRRLNQGGDWPAIDRELDGHFKSLDKSLSGPMSRMRYALSSIIIPNTHKAALTAVRHETMRRLTVVAIALKRYELKNHGRPPTLATLIPDYISAVPMDPMNGKPLGYRLDSEFGFVLYSVGADGIDDGGQARPVTPANGGELWDWKDWVWPMVTTTNL
jgi:hypothetical protein